jgi:hypothetical protein
VGVLLQAFLGKADVHFVAHPFEVEEAVADGCVVVEHLVEFA